MSQSDLNVVEINPLISPEIVQEEIKVDDMTRLMISTVRNEIISILNGDSKKIVVVVGPCSIHDPKAALDYAHKLKPYLGLKNLRIVMRVYFEKPRTTVGWKGLINDPNLDGSYKVNRGIWTARQLLADITSMGIPVGCEFLDTITPQYIADLVSWGAIGARTTESQVHRELASGLSMPIGFKNGTDGSVQIALDAVKAASSPHVFPGVTKQGLAAIVKTRGNKNCHIILRGSNSGPNYFLATDFSSKMMIDFSHGNSKKKCENQPLVCNEVSQMLIRNQNIIGVMIESNLVSGNQKLSDPGNLVYGQSITDECVDFQTTIQMLNQLDDAVSHRPPLKRSKNFL